MAIEVTNLRVRAGTTGRIGRQYAGSHAASLPPEPYLARDPHLVGNAITPELLTGMLRERNLGWRWRWVDFADEQKRNNPHLQSQLKLAQDAVAETRFRVVLPEGVTGAAGDKVLDGCTRLYAAWQRAGLPTWLKQITGAEYYGAGAHEVLWTRDGREVIPGALVHLRERRLSYACDPRDPEPLALRLYDPEVMGPPWGTKLGDFGPDKVLCHEPYYLGGPRTAEGIFSAVVWYTVFAVWCWRDLMALNEMVGRPPAVAYYAAGGAARAGDVLGGTRYATDPEIAAGKAAVFGLSGSLRAILPDTVRLEMLASKLPAGTPVQLLTEERANALIAKAIHGVANVSDLKEGARASVEVQERTSDTPWRARCHFAAGQLTTLLGWYVRANPDLFGTDAPLPLVEADVEPTVDRLTRAQGLKEAMGLGVQVGRAWAHRELQIPQPKDGEPLLELPAPTPPAPPAPADPADPARTTPPNDPPPAPPQPQE